MNRGRIEFFRSSNVSWPNGIHFKRVMWHSCMQWGWPAIESGERLARWCDYFVPQLYWAAGAPQQPYLGLLQWWTQHNPKGRHLYAGLYTSRINDTPKTWYPQESLGQVMT